MLKKATLLIPLAFNDGTAIPRETLAAIEDELFLTFKGWVLVGEVQAAYQMRQTKEKRVERLLHYWVAFEDSTLPALKQMIARFAAILRQETIYFEVSDSYVELIPPEETSDD